MPNTEYRYTIVFDSEPEGGYTVTCPALPGLVTYGASLEEARENAAEAIQGCLESLRELGRPIPPSEEHERQPIRDEIAVALDAL